TAMRLPNFNGKLRAEDLVLERYHLGKTVEADLRVERDEIHVPTLAVVMGDGKTTIEDVRVAPLQPDVPFSIRRVAVKEMQFPGLMRDLGVTEKTIVAWNFGDTTVSDFHGKLAIPELEGRIHADTRDFEIFDRGFADPERRHMIGVPKATVDGRILVRPTALEFRDSSVSFGQSKLFVNLVAIGFSNELEVGVAEHGLLQLADISPIATIPLSGQATVSAHLKGLASNPLVLGNLRIQNFVFGGFPVGDILSSNVKFWPLKVELTDVKAQKGQSQFSIDKARLEFDTDATVLVDAHAKSRDFDLRDFMAMWNFADDPRWADVRGGGALEANVHYSLGGAEDTCDAGLLRVDGKLGLNRAELFGERFDSADGEIALTWLDQAAGFLGLSLDVPHLQVRKGPGAIIGSFQVRPGAKLMGQAVATKIPLNRLDGPQPFASYLDAELSAVAEVGGTLDAMTGTVQLSVTPIHAGSATLPASEATVRIESPPRQLNSIGVSRCGFPIPGPFDIAEFQADKSQGDFRIDGQLLGGQLQLQNFAISRQANKHIRGQLHFNRLDLGSWVEALPANLRPEGRTAGALTGSLDIEDLPLAAPKRMKGQFVLSDMAVEQGKLAARVLPGGGPISLSGGRLEVPGLVVLAGVGGVLNASVDITGSIDALEHDPQLHASLHLRPVDLEPLAAMFTGVERLSGVLSGHVDLDGALAAPKSKGALGVQRGEVELRDFGVPITGIELGLALAGNEIRIETGHARVGSGTIELSGSAPVVGLEVGLLRMSLKARGLVLPERMGIRGLADADLETLVDPRNASGRPRITGQVWLDALEYDRPVTMTADVASLAQRGRRSNVESYDPSDDVVDFDLLLYARRPLRIRNGLIEAELEVDKSGLQLIGTNQRFGLRGNVRAVPGGRVTMRQTVFEIREGQVRFDDAHRILPRVDVRAVTDYRRYTSHATMGTAAATSTSGATGTGSVAGATGGQWRITMHAHGDADQLRIDLTSDPALSQDDIFLLLTIGVTRAELDQAQSASVGSSVALEALGTLSGADRAVTETIPIIDDFRFGSAYSARTGRTEPTVTIGKRLADRIRANVTSGLAESREVRSNVEWRLNPKVSVEASYDNVNDISMSQLGNLGADIRWRVEFR
ncbi:MAG TPA: translocation/assembly module TamB domain-containing protein, partial [Polyangiaceae bacterium]